MYYIGYDIGSSSVKVAIVEAETGKKVVSLHEPQNEMAILSVEQHWAEQDPNMWWRYVCLATQRALKESKVDAHLIQGIGISYQMHGLVVVDKDGNPLRDSIIWCDSRAVDIGNKAYQDIGALKCMKHLMNSPSNFTASKLKWVRDHEKEVYNKAYKFMLPGDYIAYKLTNTIATTKNGLSQGILWDFKEDRVADWLLEYFDIDQELTPHLVENFTNQGVVSAKAAKETGLPTGIPVNYRAGDQSNNALSLNIFNHGEVAATGGTSGVLYAVTNQINSQEAERINQFAHVNHSKNKPSIGKLLCINGTGIMYSWLKNQFKEDTYEAMNKMAETVLIGSEGLSILPFGNGAERMFRNKTLGAQFCNLNLNKHSKAHLFRAALEGIAFSFVYGMDILKNDHADVKVIRAGNDNLFRSKIFAETVATLIGHPIEIYNTTGAVGAARAAGLTDANFKAFGDRITSNDYVETHHPLEGKDAYITAYNNWLNSLNNKLKE